MGSRTQPSDSAPGVSIAQADAQIDADLAARFATLQKILGGFDSLLVAYSGGVDSTFVLRVAHDLLGDRVAALTTTSAALPEHERQEAIDLAVAMGVGHLLVPTDEVAITDYARNPINRCYFCKDNLYRICHAVAAERGVAGIVDGVNLDDLGDFRPGLDAAQEQAIRHPLVEARLGKADVRRLSASLGLSTWDKPASPCLASRFPYGTEITHERLSRVERAEKVLREAGLREFRVRFEEDTARLEIAAAEIARAVAPDVRDLIVAGVTAAGFRRVVLDLAGFKSGSLNPAGVPRAPQTKRS